MIPIQLLLEGKNVLVVGAGKVALRKSKLLIDKGAIVTVIAPIIHSEFHKVQCRIHEKSFENKDVQGYYMVIAATNDKKLNDYIYRVCNNKNIWCSTVTNGSSSDFNFLTFKEDDHITIAVGTNGKSPFFGKWLLKKLVHVVDRDILNKFKAHSMLREVVVKNIEEGKEKRRLLKDALNLSCDAIIDLAKGIERGGNDGTENRDKR